MLVVDELGEVLRALEVHFVLQALPKEKEGARAVALALKMFETQSLFPSPGRQQVEIAEKIVFSVAGEFVVK